MKRSLVLCAVALLAFTANTASADVDVQLNLRYDDPANEAAGGVWDLLIKSDNGGVAGIVVLIDNIDLGSVATAGTTGYNVFEKQINGSVVEIVTGFDLAGPALDVGTGAGTTGNVAIDDLFSSNSTWHNSALIASGTFGAARPTFETTSGTHISGSNVFSGTDAVFANFDLLSVRGDGVATDGLLAGDANRDGGVTGADFAALQNNFNGSGDWDGGDFNSSGTVTGADFAALQNSFGSSAASPALANLSVVPEPTSLALLCIGAIAGLGRRRR